jgi:uncharacterized protein (TIGR03435 family)
MPPMDGKPVCGGGTFNVIPPNQIIDFKAASMDDIARTLLIALDRPVVNKTGIAGLFAMHLEFEPGPESPRFAGRGRGAEPAAESADKNTGPSIFTVLQEQGLKLEPAKGPKEFLVVEHVEKPTEN